MILVAFRVCIKLCKTVCLQQINPKQKHMIHLHRPKWFTVSSIKCLHSSSFDTFARITITSGDPSSRALFATI